MTKYTWKVLETESNKIIATRLKMSQARQLLKNLISLNPDMKFEAINIADIDPEYNPEKEEE